MNKAEETIRTAYLEKIDAVIDYWNSQEYDPCNTNKKWRAAAFYMTKWPKRSKTWRKIPGNHREC